METRKLGKLNVTTVGLGCNNFGWRIGQAETNGVVDAAIASAINFFDTADMYATGESETFLGTALGKRRKEVVIATKFGFEMGEGKAGASPSYVKEAAHASLSRLGTDYIDLYLLHRPDPETPIADTLGALQELVLEGKVLEIGCSNFSAKQMAEAAAAIAPGTPGFTSVQNEYSMMHREPEKNVIPECERLGISFIPYFPLANGLLTGKYRKGKPLPANSRGNDGWGPAVFSDSNLDIVENLITFASDHNHTLLELAISWLAAQKTVVSVIAGSKSIDQVKQNAAAGSWKLSADELKMVDKILAGQ
jgi:aryl-alcohol dehydrogenase-like predicted oxidoreductase